MKSRDLKALGPMRDALREREQALALREQQRLAALAQATQKARLFADSVGAVTSLPWQQRADLQIPRPLPEPRQRELDEAAALREALSDLVDVDSLLLTDDGLSFRREGVPADVVSRLRRGHWAIQGEIDLHGLRRDAARETLAAFVRDSARRGQRCLRVVHGKGHGSPGRQPVLKDKVQRWLAQCGDVMAFVQASGPQGGAGALVVLLGKPG